MYKEKYYEILDVVENQYHLLEDIHSLIYLYNNNLCDIDYKHLDILVIENMNKLYKYLDID